MRLLGQAERALSLMCKRVGEREAFGKKLIDHEGVGFMLAENLIDLKQAELMIDWCAGVLDGGSLGTAESSMAKVAVSEALMRIADRCVQVMGGMGVSGGARCVSGIGGKARTAALAASSAAVLSAAAFSFAAFSAAASAAFFCAASFCAASSAAFAASLGDPLEALTASSAVLPVLASSSLSMPAEPSD